MSTIIGGIITTNQVADIRVSGYAPRDRRESAIIADLAPGNYTVIVRGVNIYPSAVEQIVRAHPEVTEFRVRLLTREALREMEVDIEISNGSVEAITQQLQQDFEAAFRLRVPVISVPPGTLPRSENKSRHFVTVA